MYACILVHMCDLAFYLHKRVNFERVMKGLCKNIPATPPYLCHPWLWQGEVGMVQKVQPALGRGTEEAVLWETREEREHLMKNLRIQGSFLLVKLLFYSYSIAVVPIFLPLHSSTQPTPSSLLPQSIATLLSTSMGHAYIFFSPFPFFPPLSPTLLLLWPLSVCSMFPCPWFYFAC